MLTASHLYQYTSCPRWPWNEMHGNPEARRGPSEFLKKLLADGLEHEKSIYAALGPVRVTYPPGDHAAGALETLRLMAAGAPLIAQAVLRSPAGRRGVADLLERRPGRSALGDWTYEPVEIKTARAVKPVYRLQLAFYAHLLAEILGEWPERAHVILLDGSRHSFPLADVRLAYESILAHLHLIAAGREPPVHIGSTCGDCPWEPTCLPHAEKTRDVSLTYGLQRRVATGLRERGIGDLAGLAALDAADVAQWTGIGAASARQLVTQARALEQGAPIWRGAAAFPEHGRDLYFDIEGDPEHDVLYLFGVLVREHGADGAGSETYRAFVAEEPGEERRAFLELLDFLESQDGATIYHYHHYERSALRQLGERHRVDPARVAGLLERLRDLNRDLVQSVVLPVYSYSLKAVAKSLGYRWRHPEASAAQSMVWYSSWLKGGDRRFLDWAVEYNEDDCRATRVLKEWLAAGPDGAAPEPSLAGLRGGAALDALDGRAAPA
jgi:predicted RecB family nuclease